MLLSKADEIRVQSVLTGKYNDLFRIYSILQFSKEDKIPDTGVFRGNNDTVFESDVSKFNLILCNRLLVSVKWSGSEVEQQAINNCYKCVMQIKYSGSTLHIYKLIR